jgi:uncharacterized protein with HEPN domain
LVTTLAELRVCIGDAAEIVALGRARFDAERLVQRAAKNVVSELAETVGRLPVRVRHEHPDVPWPDIVGMRNIVVHQSQRIDPDVVWNALASDVPALGTALGFG